MFNPAPLVRRLALGPRQSCIVVDDALLRPDKLVAYADAYREDFQPAPPTLFPGVQMRMPAEFTALLAEVFREHARHALGARRTRLAGSRLSLVTLPPAALPPAQWLCRRAHASGPDQCVVTAELYLFQDPALGGTHFFLPRASPAQIEQVLHDADALPPDEFALRHGIAPGYPRASNACFDHVATLEPAWNRLVFHGEDVFHAPAIGRPERLNADPRSGRLTLTAAFTCSRPRVPW